MSCHIVSLSWSDCKGSQHCFQSSTVYIHPTCHSRTHRCSMNETVVTLNGISYGRVFLISASPSCLAQADCSAQLGGRSAAAAAVKRWATDLSDHSYPSSKRGLQANHTQLSRAPPCSTSSTQKHRDVTERSFPFLCTTGKRQDGK